MLQDMLNGRLFYSLPYNVRRALFSGLNRDEYRRLQNQRTIDTKDDYSYKPFDQYHCIFVHIPKAAGVSVCRSLFGNLAGGHTPIQRYQIIFSKEEFDDYFKFTFVRNPWDRVFSAYNFLKKGGMNDDDRKWGTENLDPYISFEDFITRGLKKPNILQWVHFRHQHEFLCNPCTGNLLIDFLGFYENIQEDFQYIADKLLGGVNLALKSENKTHTNGKSDYKSFYTQEMRNIVAHVYKKDIDLFGYNFDNSSLNAQLTSRFARPGLPHHKSIGGFGCQLNPI